MPNEGKPGYSRRSLRNNKKLPPFSWLYNYAGAWRMLPDKHPTKCSWCGSEYLYVQKRWHLCPKCDRREEKKT